MRSERASSNARAMNNINPRLSNSFCCSSTIGNAFKRQLYQLCNKVANVDCELCFNATKIMVLAAQVLSNLETNALRHLIETPSYSPPSNSQSHMLPQMQMLVRYHMPHPS